MNRRSFKMVVDAGSEFHCTVRELHTEKSFQVLG